MYVKRTLETWLMCDAPHVDGWKVTPQAIIEPGEEHYYQSEPHSVRHLACAEGATNNVVRTVAGPVDEEPWDMLDSD